MQRSNFFPQKTINLQTLEHLWRATTIRFIITAIVFAITTFIFSIQRLPVYALLSATFFLTLIYFIFLKFKAYLDIVANLQVIFDVLILTILIYYTGGIDSILTLLYPLVIIQAGLIINPRASAMAGLFASLSYTAIVVLEFFNIIPANNTADSFYVFSMLYFKVAVFCIIGFLSAYLAGQINLRSQKITALEIRLKREEKLSAVGKLAAGIAHEIRNPLACISGAIDALNETLLLDEENRKLMQLILKESERLNNIIAGLLEYVRPLVLKKQRVNFIELCEEVITLFKNNKNFNPKVNIVAIIPEQRTSMISCDKERMQQVVLNLLVNAMEAMPNGGDIKLEINNINSKYLLFKVTDQGVGIAPDRIEKIFEPFNTDKDKGVGLGLAIVRNIIDEHKGTINVESVLGKGTSFIVNLPR